MLADDLLACARADPERVPVGARDEPALSRLPRCLAHRYRLETVVERHQGFWVVEKNGEAGEEAESLAEGTANPL